MALIAATSHERMPVAPGFAYAQQSQMMITKLPAAGWL